MSVQELIPRGLFVANVLPEVNARRLSALHLAVFMRRLFDSYNLRLLLREHVPLALQKINKLRELNWGNVQNEQDLLFIDLEKDLTMLLQLQNLYDDIIALCATGLGQQLEKRIVNIRALMATPLDVLYSTYKNVTNIVAHKCIVPTCNKTEGFLALYVLFKCFLAVGPSTNSLHFVLCVFDNTSCGPCQWPGCKTRWAAEVTCLQSTASQYSLSLFLQNNINVAKEVAKILQNNNLDYTFVNVLTTMLANHFYTLTRPL